MEKIIIPALLIGFLSAPLTAGETTSRNQQVSPFYATLELGVQKNKFSDVEVSSAAPAVIGTKTVDRHDKAGYFSVGVGYEWKNSDLRTELSYKKVGRQSFVDRTLFSVFTPEETPVDVKQELLMLETLYDFKIKDSKIVPYAGMGLGVSRIRVSANQYDVPLQPGRSASFSSHTDINFAWSLVAGADYEISKKINLGVGYRYTDAGKVSTDDNCVGSDANICDMNEKHSADLRSHSLFVKANYHF